MADVRSAVVSLLAPALALGLTACGDDAAGVPCDSLAAELAAAAPGETVRVGACRAAGDLSVPDGVTLAGAGADATVVEGSVTLGDGAALESLSVRPAAGAAVSASGGTVRLDAVRLAGSVTPENATEVPPMPSSDAYPTHGLFLDSTMATLTDVSVSGFAGFGVLALDSDLSWSGGSASANLAVGLMTVGGRADLDGVELCRTLQGVQPLPAYAAVFSAGTEVTTTGVTACDNEGFGILQDDADVAHVDLVGSGNSEPALWAQRSPSFELTGDATVLSGNRIAGVVLVQTPMATIRDAQIDDGELARRIITGLGDVEAGDGIHVVADTTASTRIQNVSLTGNQRVGVLIDLGDGGTVDPATLADLTVEATGEAYGVIAQTPTGPIPSGGWDDSVTRLGDAVANDPAFTGRLDVVGIVGPMYLPPVE